MSLTERYGSPYLSGFSSKEMLKVSELKKIFSVGGMSPDGWISKMDRLGCPLKVYKGADGVRRFRVGEIVARARARNAEIGPPQQKKQSERSSIPYFEIQKGKARTDRHELEVAELSRLLTARSLRQEHEIVRKAKAVEKEMLCGVYFLVSGDRVVYVGQSTNVYSRVNTHLSDTRKIFDSWCFIRCERRMLDVLESLYIHFLQPSQQGKIGQSDQLSTPLTMDELFNRVTLRRSA